MFIDFDAGSRHMLDSDIVLDNSMQYFIGDASGACFTPLMDPQKKH